MSYYTVADWQAVHWIKGERRISNLPGNPGDFLALMRLLGKYNNDIKCTLSSLKNATYLSPRIQNELIVIMGVHIIQRKLVDENKKAKLFTILVDDIVLNIIIIII